MGEIFLILFLRFFIPIYSIVFFATVFVYRTITVGKQIQKNPLVLPTDDSAYSLAGFYFKLVAVSLAMYVCVFSLLYDWYNYFGPFKSLELLEIQIVGLIIWIFVLILTVIAQHQMKSSWRIGIDTEMKTKLVTHGLFRFSRNPIFLGLILNFIGLFLITPNTVTLLLMIIGSIIIQFQVRLEEQHLTNSFGNEYLDYKKRVRRFM